MKSQYFLVIAHNLLDHLIKYISKVRCHLEVELKQIPFMTSTTSILSYNGLHKRVLKGVFSETDLSEPLVPSQSNYASFATMLNSGSTSLD